MFALATFSWVRIQNRFYLIINSFDDYESVPVDLRIGDAFPLLGLLFFPPLGLLVLDPSNSVTDLLQNLLLWISLVAQFLHEVLGRDKDLGVLLQKFGEVLEEGVLGSKEVELIVPLLSLHQVGQKLTTIPENTKGYGVWVIVHFQAFNCQYGMSTFSRSHHFNKVSET